MAKTEAKKNYIHFIPAAADHSEYPAGNEHVLISNIEELREALATKADHMAWDLETSSLDPTVGFIVGYSFAFSASKGYYVPVNHINEPRLGKEALDLLYDRLLKLKSSFVYNMRFDFRYMESAGYLMSKVPYYDVAVGVWLADTNKKNPSLKWAAKHFLGWAPDTFKSTLGDNYNFYFLDPIDAYKYGAGDAEETYAVAQKTIKYYVESKVAGKLDNEFLYPLMKFEDSPLPIDVDYLSTILEEEQIILKDLELEIYRVIGYPININSSQQLSEALKGMGINTGVFTGTGQMSVSIKALEEYKFKTSKKGEEVPAIIDQLMDYSKKTKLVGSYLKTLRDGARVNEGKLRFSYNTTNAPTGRLAGGSDKKNPYFAHINIQALPKPVSLRWFVHKDSEIKDKDDIVVNGWRFSKMDKSDMIIEGQNPDVNVRRSFITNSDQYWVSCDYASQELRIVANYANEPVWVDTFLGGGDLHTNMAVTMWGKENYSNDNRKKAKILNFGMCLMDESRILTDAGYIRTKDLDYSQKIGNRFGRFNHYKYKIEHNVEGYLVQYKNGIIESYKKGHQLLCWNGLNLEWIRVEDIVDEEVVYSLKSLKLKGDSFRVNLREYTQNKNKYSICIDFTEGLWPYLLGSYLGDGYSKDRGMEWVIEDSILQEVREFLESQGFNVGITKVNKVNIVRISSRALSKAVVRHFGRTDTKRIADFVFTHYDDFKMREFLAGLIDTDGSYSKGRLIFKNTNELLVSDVALLCHCLGIDTRLFKSKAGVTEDGVRRYKSLEGIEYKKCMELHLKNGGNEICKYSRKHGGIDGWKSFYKVDTSLAKQIKSENNRIYDSWYNTEHYTGKVSDKVIMETTSNTEGFAVLKNIVELGGSTSIISREVIVGNAYQIGIIDDEPEYLSSSMVSHNCYGMSAKTIAERFHVTEDEAKDIEDRYWKAAPQIKRFQKGCVSQAKKKGYICNYFGRPRRVRYWLSHEDYGQRAFGERTVGNTVIQSVGAELLKLATLKLWERLLNHADYKDKVRFMTTVHDEVNFAVDKDILTEAVVIIKDCMEMKFPNWKIPIEIGIEIGDSWGRCFPFKFEDGELVPDYEVIK